MSEPERKEMPYDGFEQGPIRPPSEAASLLIRVTRNCPWNRCSFCPVYKGSRFSLRPVAHVMADIDAVHRCLEGLLCQSDRSGGLTREQIRQAAAQIGPVDPGAFQAALHWHLGGMTSIFLQDANSLILPPDDLVEILAHLRKRFPWSLRITSYARSHTVARISDEDLVRMRGTGLDRIHIGLESGCDKVLEHVQKGVTREIHIRAGKKIKAAGMELSEYVMPGLGGRALSREHALDTADALNQIDPDFIRLRTLALPGGTKLAEEHASGRFTKCTDRMMAEEILLFLEHLDGIGSRVKSDHILNLFEEVQGRLPDDKVRMTDAIRRFLSMPPQEQMVYQVGRRLGLFARLDDMADPPRYDQAQEACRRFGIRADNVDDVIDELMKRFV